MRFSTAVTWIGGATLLSLVAQFLIAKVVSIYLSMGDFGIIGQYLSLVNIVQLLGGGAFTAAIVKYTAEYSQSCALTMQEFYNTAITIIILISMFSVVLLLFLAPSISNLLFSSETYKLAIVLLSVAILPISYCKFIQAMSSGFSRVKLYAFLASSLSISLALIFILLFFYNHTVMAVFLAFPCSYIITLPIFYLISKRIKKQHNIAPYRPTLKWKHARSLLVFAFMPMVTMIVSPIIQIIIRLVISGKASWVIIGQWQAVNKISDAYTMVVCMVFLNYIVPLFSSLDKKIELIKVFRATLYKVFIVGFLLLIFLILFREPIILLLYSNKYMSIMNLTTIQFIGDFFRILGFFSMYILIAKAQIKIFIIIELCSTLLLLLLTLVGYHYIGLLGMFYGYLINAILFFIISFAGLLVFLRQCKK